MPRAKIESAFEAITTPVRERVVEALLKMSMGIRRFAWDRAAAAGLTPTQGEILRAVARAPDGLRMRAIAAGLAVSAPTATDAVAALEKKGLVRRVSEEDDRRASRVLLTDQGKKLGRQLDEWFDSVADAVSTLPEPEEQHLLRMLMEILRVLHAADGMPTLKMCVTCRHFSPYASEDPRHPHRCELVGSAFADRHLRIDCAEQEPAESDAAAERWVRLRHKKEGV